MEPNKKTECKKRKFRQKVITGIATLAVGFLVGFVAKTLFEKPPQIITRHHYHSTSSDVSQFNDMHSKGRGDY
jgi:hypothetical protein